MTEQNNKRLPKDWKTEDILDVCEVYQPKTISTKQLIEDGKYDVYGANGIIGKFDKYNHEESEVLVTCRGATCGTVNISKPKSWVNGNAMVIKPRNNKILKLFIAYYFKSINLNDVITGSAQPQITRTTLSKKTIPLPPLPEQHRIVAKIEELFSELDKAVENLQTARQQLKTYRQSVLKHAFEGKLTATWRESSKFRVQSSKFKNESLKLVAEPESVYQTKNGLPEGWKVDYLQNLADIKGGVTKGRKLDGKQTINLPYLRVANVQDGYLDLSEIKYIDVLEDDLEKYRLELNDVLFTEGGDKDKLGRGSIWKNEIENCIHQNHIFRARIYSSNILLSKHLTYFAQSPKGKDYFFQNAKQTVNLASINKTILSNLPVPVCPIEEQNQIVAEIEKRFSEADKLEESIETALRQTEALRQSILKKAFAGKLVEPDENKAGE